MYIHLIIYHHLHISVSIIAIFTILTPSWPSRRSSIIKVKAVLRTSFGAALFKITKGQESKACQNKRWLKQHTWVQNMHQECQKIYHGELSLSWCMFCTNVDRHQAWTACSLRIWNMQGGQRLVWGLEVWRRAWICSCVFYPGYARRTRGLEEGRGPGVGLVSSGASITPRPTNTKGKTVFLQKLYSFAQMPFWSILSPFFSIFNSFWSNSKFVLAL